MLKDRRSRWGNYKPQSIAAVCDNIRNNSIDELCAYEHILLGNHLARQICDYYSGVEKLRITVVTYLDRVTYVRQGVSGPLSWGKYPVQIVGSSRYWIQERRAQSKREKTDITIFVSLYPLLDEERKRIVKLKDRDEKILFASVFRPAKETSVLNSFYAIK